MQVSNMESTVLKSIDDGYLFFASWLKNIIEIKGTYTAIIM